MRYLLCREMNFGLDTEFTVENLLRRFNTDLANDLGNLLNRTINMVGRYYDGVVPDVGERDGEIAELASEVCQDYVRAMSELRLNAALEAVWRLVGRMNKYVDERAPWTLAKSAQSGDTAAQQRLAVTLTTCLEAVRVASVLLTPFMPRAAGAIRAQLGLSTDSPAVSWHDTAWSSVTAGTRVGPPQPLFPRIQELTVDEAALIELGAIRREVSHHSVDNEKGRAVSDNEMKRSATSAAPGTPVVSVGEVRSLLGRSASTISARWNSGLGRYLRPSRFRMLRSCFV